MGELRNDTVAFGPFRLERSPLRLYRGEEIALREAQPLTVLLHLLENPERFVPAQELYDKLWSGTQVTDLLKVHINKIRKALDDNPHRPNYIETRRHHGYRFIGNTADNTPQRQESKESPNGFPDNIPLVPKVKCSRNEVELKWVSELEQKEYGGDSVDDCTLIKWWKSYPKGVHVVQVGVAIIGAMGIWPISKKIFHDIINGRIEETQIGRHRHDVATPQTSHRYWYVGDIILHKDYRENASQKSNLLVPLLHRSINEWLRGGDVNTLVDICAFAFTPEGEKLLEKFEFVRHVRTSPNKKYPIYVKTASLKELRAELNKKVGKLLPQNRRKTVNHK